jgi:hypothetical protein
MKQQPNSFKKDFNDYLGLNFTLDYDENDYFLKADSIADEENEEDEPNILHQSHSSKAAFSVAILAAAAAAAAAAAVQKTPRSACLAGEVIKRHQSMTFIAELASTSTPTRVAQQPLASTPKMPTHDPFMYHPSQTIRRKQHRRYKSLSTAIAPSNTFQAVAATVAPLVIGSVKYKSSRAPDKRGEFEPILSSSKRIRANRLEKQQQQLQLPQQRTKRKKSAYRYYYYYSSSEQQLNKREKIDLNSKCCCQQSRKHQRPAIATRRPSIVKSCPFKKCTNEDNDSLLNSLHADSNVDVEPLQISLHGSLQKKNSCSSLSLVVLNEKKSSKHILKNATKNSKELGTYRPTKVMDRKRAKICEAKKNHVELNISLGELLYKPKSRRRHNSAAGLKRPARKPKPTTSSCTNTNSASSLTLSTVASVLNTNAIASSKIYYF